jgi:hypothetical protein
VRLLGTFRSICNKIVSVGNGLVHSTHQSATGCGRGLLGVGRDVGGQPQMSAIKLWGAESDGVLALWQRVSAPDADGPNGRFQFVGVVRLFDDRHGDHPFKQLPHLPDALTTGNDDR